MHKMSYQALYRVWRPMRLSDVVGQEHITKTLKNALVQQKLSHAYLFTGPRGTGKTSAAKIISKAINCEKAPVEEPCNECPACVGIQNGTIVDVMEIDAASNNGVDEIRDIRDKVKFAPSAVKYKVYIIDEVHMLSTGAFNALLKTLEEPPAHVIFILATTEPHKIPLTIISRCQRFDFKRISREAMIKRMKEIVDSIQVTVEDEAIDMIARAAEGGMRDALSLLDQAISYADDVVTVSDVRSIIGAVSQKLIYDVALAIENGDVAKGLTAVDTVIKEGKDPNRFLDDLIYFYRDILMVKAAPELDESKARLESDDTFKKIVDTIDEHWIYQVIEKLNEAQQQMKWSNHASIFLEMLIVQLCNLEHNAVHVSSTGVEQNDTIKMLLNRVNELEAKVRRLTSGTEILTEKSSGNENKNGNRVNHRQLRASGKSRAQINKVKGMLYRAKKQYLQSISAKWPHILEQVRAQNVPAHAWLIDCQPVACSESEVVLSFKNEMHREMIDDKFRELVEMNISTVMGRSFSILTLLSNHWEETKEAFLREQNRDGQKEDEEDKENPLVQEAIKLVGEELVEIKD